MAYSFCRWQLVSLSIHAPLARGLVILAVSPRSVPEMPSCREETPRRRCSKTFMLRTLPRLQNGEPRECSSLNDTLILALPWREPSNPARPLCSFRSSARWKFSFQNCPKCISFAELSRQDFHPGLCRAHSNVSTWIPDLFLLRQQDKSS